MIRTFFALDQRKNFNCYHYFGGDIQEEQCTWELVTCV